LNFYPKKIWKKKKSNLISFLKKILKNKNLNIKKNILSLPFFIS
jgi:hypothetical protein